MGRKKKKKKKEELPSTFGMLGKRDTTNQQNLETSAKELQFASKKNILIQNFLEKKKKIKTFFLLEKM